MGGFHVPVFMGAAGTVLRGREPILVQEFLIPYGKPPAAAEPKLPGDRREVIGAVLGGHRPPPRSSR
jgi:hypothetical protein